MARIEWPEFYFKRLQETSTVILPRKGPEREWGYPDIPHQLRGLVGQNRGNGANRTVTGDISIPRYLYLPPIGYQWRSTRHSCGYYLAKCSTPNGNQRKSTTQEPVAVIAVAGAQRLTAINGRARLFRLQQPPESAQRL
jgi:hypothetical protein